MDYALQEKYLRAGRIRAMAVVALLAVLAFFNVAFAKPSAPAALAFVLILAAVAVSVCYTPDYLHLTVRPDKPARWQLKIRWRFIACVLILGLSLSRGRWEVFKCLEAVAWLTLANLMGRRFAGRSYFPLWFWLTDLLLISFLLLQHGFGPLVTVGLLAISAHLVLVINEERVLLFATAVTVCSWLFLLAAWSTGSSRQFQAGAAALLLTVAMATAWLVSRADRQNTRNFWKATGELSLFTNYHVEEIYRRWQESDGQLAKNWTAAAPDESDRTALAEWYRQNSELYMFAISAYNLDYKRIRSNLKVLQYARGACLDYGAGNGEILLELARRGHPVTYFDVEGVSARFAQDRAQRQNLEVKFRFSKEALTEDRFDTIFSLDVLEHVPDLQGELNFLSSLLKPGGLLLFDVPAGATRSHPMHLNHDLDFRSLLTGKGMGEKRSLWHRLPFVKQEKFVFERARGN
jgi:2-polyprenyl-3-methyl-5-hydroxy-6-metoxy-1,4-benzoquinol methylase